MPSDFYTLAGYQRQEPEGLTASMEDYLEMICRCSEKNQPIRIHTLAEKLNVDVYKRQAFIPKNQYIFHKKYTKLIK